MDDAATPPTPDGLPLLGNGLAFSRDPVGAMTTWAELGGIVRVEVPGQSIHVVTDPELVRQILVDEHGKFSIGPAQQDAFRGVEDHAVTSATGDRWERLRAALRPAFRRAAVERYGDRVPAATADVVDGWDDGERFDLFEELRLVTVNALADALLDVDLGGDERVVLDAADALVDRANFRRPGQLLPDWVPTPTQRRFERSVRSLDEYVDDVLSSRAAAESDASSPSGAADDDVCSLLLAARDRGDVTTDEVRHNVVALLLAGSDSPAVALTSAWYLLSEHPDVRDELVAEYEAVVDGDRPSFAAVDDLEKTGNVVAETLRLYPPTTGVTRQATEPVTVGGYDLPAGTEFLMPQWVPHRDERFWDDPTSFDPGRWANPSSPADSSDRVDPSDRTDRPDCAYFPFGAGPRNCVGRPFARVQLTLALATMVGRVDLDVAADGPLTFTPSLQLRPDTELTATVRRRD